MPGWRHIPSQKLKTLCRTEYRLCQSTYRTGTGNNPQYVARESITQWQMMDGRTAKGRISCRNSKITPDKSGANALTWHGHGCHFEKYRLQRNDIQELVSKGLAKVED